MKILLVEDDKGIARFVKKGLSENAFSVDLVSDGEEGLRPSFEIITTLSSSTSFSPRWTAWRF